MDTKSEEYNQRFPLDPPLPIQPPPVRSFFFLQTKFNLGFFHQFNSCFASPITSDVNEDLGTDERGFIQISPVIIPKITPLNITY